MSLNSSDDRWDFYSCQINDVPHSTMVNLSLLDPAPIKALGIFHCIEIDLKHPDPKHGMSTDEEFQTLNDIEDVIFQHEGKNLRYVARQTGGGKRKFYFYGTSDTELGSLIENIGKSFPDYEKSTFNFEDAEWQTYFGDLYPNAIAMNEILNRGVFVLLEKDGDDLSIPRTIDHHIIFQSRKAANEFEAIVKEQGFTVETNAKGILKKTFGLLVQRSDPPLGLDPVTYELRQLAERLGGEYDGWGCSVETQKS